MTDPTNADAGRALEGQPNPGSDTGVAPPAPCSGVFSECRAGCPHHVQTPNGGGGWQHDCSHPENCPHLPIDQTPCDPRVCPIFTAQDPEGDEENCRYEHEVEGQWCSPNTAVS